MIFLDPKKNSQPITSSSIQKIIDVLEQNSLSKSELEGRAERNLTHDHHY